MTEVDEAAIEKRAKENCALNGLQWESDSLSRSAERHGKKTGGMLDDATRKIYLTEAHRQLLDEAGKNL